MKDFFKYVLATLTGFVLAGFAVVVLGLVSVTGILMSESSAPDVKSGSLLHIDLNGELTERYVEDPFSSLLGDNFTSIGLEQVLGAIEKAKTHPDICGIYLSAGMLSGASPAMTEEIRQALVDFKTSGKFIVAYGDTYTQGCYHVCSAADCLMLNPQGMLDWHGMGAQPIFFKEMLEKIGVRMQVFKVGAYKSAVEPFTATEMSEANREQIQSYVGSIWRRKLADVSAARKLSVELLNAYADTMLALTPAEELLRMRMVDTLCYRDGLRDYLRQRTGTKGNAKLPLLTVSDMEKLPAAEKPAGDEVAVYYAYGDIVDNALPGGTPCISASAVCRDLQRLRTDKKVKAVVIRVNSGGGSAYASEQIWREVKLLQETKPVVVSMGGMAASGGYYMSCCAGTLFAEPTTLTGSIGIFGMFPDASELLTEKLDLHFDVVKTNRLSDFGTSARPFNETERHLLQAYIERGYDLFTRRVSEGRKMDIERVKELAQGRVWTGEQAVENGLVDSLGNLKDAVALAARKCGAKTYTEKHYPEPAPWYENLLARKREGYLNSRLRQVLGNYYGSTLLLQQLNRQHCIQARMPYDPNFIN